MLCVTSTSAMPRSRCRPRSRSRICAWIVTSSAVVGSSAMSRLRVAGDRHRDHHPLVHAAGELVREVAQAARRAPGCRPARAARSRACAPRLRSRPRCSRSVSVELEADGEARVQAGRRLLEDHRHVLADDPAALARRTSAEQVAAAEASAASARTRPGSATRPISASIGDALARARLADDAEHLAFVERQADAVDGAQHAAVRRELDVQVFDLEQRPCRSSALELRVERVAQAVAQQVEREHGDQDREAREASPPTTRAARTRARRRASCPIRTSAAARPGRGSPARRRRGWRSRRRATPGRSAARRSWAAPR